MQALGRGLLGIEGLGILALAGKLDELRQSLRRCADRNARAAEGG